MTNPTTGAPTPPDSHSYADVDRRDDRDRLVELMEYMGRHPSSKRLYEGTRAEMQRGDRVLDIGCGTAFDAGTMPLRVGEPGSAPEHYRDGGFAALLALTGQDSRPRDGRTLAPTLTP